MKGFNFEKNLNHQLCYTYTKTIFELNKNSWD